MGMVNNSAKSVPANSLVTVYDLHSENYTIPNQRTFPQTRKPMSTPSHLFKIVASQPDMKSAKIQLTELDEESGFIHLSTGPQIPRTCHRFFSSTETLYIIKFPYEKLKPNIKWERAPDSDELFPHLYSDLWTTDVDSIREFRKGGASWMNILGRNAWLFDTRETSEDN